MEGIFGAEDAERPVSRNFFGAEGAERSVSRIFFGAEGAPSVPFEESFILSPVSGKYYGDVGDTGHEMSRWKKKIRR